MRLQEVDFRATTRNVTKARSLLMGLLFLSGLWALAQEPCGFYDIDGNSGYSEGDLHFTANMWTQTGSFPSIPDFDRNGVIDVLDLVRQSGCVADLAHGLLAKTYGFEDGTDGQSISFPDFANLPAAHQPALIDVVDRLEDLTGSTLLDTDMRRQFGVVYEGYLFVPETANYTLHIFGNRGMRVVLDGSEILSFDTSPRDDETTLPLSYGLHPIRVEYYTNTASPRILLDWSSDGSIIGTNLEVIGPDYFYHESEAPNEYVSTKMKVLFNPPSGSRTTDSQIDLEAFILNPDTGLRMWVDNVEQSLQDGRHRQSLPLQSGLNTFEFSVTDSSGNVERKRYHIYRDNEAVSGSGLRGLLYATQWYTGVPDLSELQPYAVVTSQTTQLEPNANNDLIVDGRYLINGSAIRLQGMIQISEAGEYRFRVRNTSALYINGEFVSGINALYPGQWAPNGYLDMEPGRYHYELVTYDSWGRPDNNVWWRRDGGTETKIPNSVFRWGPNHSVVTPRSTSRATGGRVANGQVVEYMFRPGHVFDDTSGNGFHLNPDPRAIPRSTGGVTYESAGAMFSEQAGVHAASRVRVNDGITLEVDYVYDKPIEDFYWRRLISISDSRWSSLVQLYQVHDNLRFQFRNQFGNTETLDAQDVVTQGQRMHVAARYDGTSMRIYVNGQLAATKPYSGQIMGWPNLAQVNIGYPYNRHQDAGTGNDQIFGTFLGAAVYDRALTQGEIQTNYQAMLAINAMPGPLPAPTVEPYLPPGTTQAQLDEAFHILNRLSFGPSPDSVKEILTSGVDNWVNRQMNPATINDTEMEAILNSDFYRPRGRESDFKGATLFRAIKSRRQLLEVMTQFWDNHFSTQLGKVNNVWQELEENETFRANALGDFSDLVKASSMGFPMTIYLDNVSNVVGAPNENFAREIFELFCMGVDNGYTQQDIVEGARCFTGWSVRNGQFYFNPGRHDYGAKSLLGLNLPAGGGISDGLRLIEHVVGLPETAEFITWKMVQLLVADDPPADVHNAAKATFLSTNGDIKRVLETIISHAQFRTDPNYRANKVKTPLEFITSLSRVTESFPMGAMMMDYLEDMGMELYEYAEPTGFPEEGVAWIDTNSMLTRWNLINDLVSNRGFASNVSFNLNRLIHKRGLTTSDELLDFFRDITTHGREQAGARAIIESWMTDDDPGNFQLTPEVLDSRVRQALALFLRLPEFNKQ